MSRDGFDRNVKALFFILFRLLFSPLFCNRNQKEWKNAATIPSEYYILTQ